MKKNLMKLIALILTVASLVSMLTVFAWAEDTTGDTTTEEAPDFDPTEHLIYKRDFDEGWEAVNGSSLNSLNGHKAYIDFEETSDLSYNYFARFEYANVTSAGYLEYAFGSRVAVGYPTIIGLSIKADDACEVGNIMYATLGDKSNINILTIKDSNLYAFSTASSNFVCSLADGDWYDIDIIYDWTNPSTYTAKVLLDGEVVVETSGGYGGTGIQTLFIGLAAPGNNAATKEGMSYCVDNLRIYQNQPKPIDLSSYGNGVLVDQNAEKTVDIYENANDKSAAQILEESLAMKLGVNSALMSNVKIDINGYFTPAVVNGKVMVSLDLVLDYIGYPYYVHSNGTSYDITIGPGANAYASVGLTTATVNGQLVDLDTPLAVATNNNGESAVVIDINDINKIVPEYLVVYDDMGLIIVYENIAKEGEDASSLITREENLDTMLDTMKKFVFDTVTTDEYGFELTEEETYTATGDALYEATKANTAEFQHPYIFADQATFDNLKAIYAAADSDATVKGYIAGIVAKADAYYNEVVASEVNGTIEFVEGKEPVNVYQDGVYPDFAANPNDTTVSDSDDGYNPETSALYEIEEITENLVNLAFAYQVTGDAKYVYLAYAVSTTLGEWVHWAPGYFINCANAANDFAVSYDWLYNAYVELIGEDSVAELAAILYDKALFHGYNSVTDEFCKFPRTAGYGDKFTNRTDSWNAVSSAGMVIAALAIMEYDEYLDNTLYVAGASLVNLANNGLDQYAPDGSYIESVTYWANGTNAFMQLIMALNSAAGDDFGFKDTWGIESTFYYACHIANSNGEAWNYHEDGVGSIVNSSVISVDTQMFNFAAQLLGDANLAALRQNQLAKGKEATIYDLLFYPFDGVAEAPELELDYFMEGIDGFVSRSDWENGALYVGIMGGENAYSAYADGEGEEVFGQIDSGNFIYQNNGINWIVDLGSDYYSNYSYFGSQRYRYYRNSGEGNNVVLITSNSTEVPYGQATNAAGQMYETYIDPNGKGSYALINNSNAYGSASQSAYRGMLVTNDRKTVVIQDEISLSVAGNLTWVAHTAADVEQISDDGRTAILSEKDAEGNKVYLRATLITADSTLKFESSSLDEKLLGTNRETITATQRSMKGISRLVIKCENNITFNVAVVFEMIGSIYVEEPVNYEWLPLLRWSEAFNEVEVSDVQLRGTAVKADIDTKVIDAEVLIDAETAFSTDLVNFYVLLADFRYIALAYGIDDEDVYGSFEPDYINRTDENAIKELEQRVANYDKFLEFEELYNKFAGIVNSTNEDIGVIANAFAGL